MDELGDVFVEGTWWYNQGRSSYQTIYHEGRPFYRQVLREAKEVNGKYVTEVFGELKLTFVRELRQEGWQWEAYLSDGAKMRFCCKSGRMVTSHLRPGSSEWRPPVIARLGPAADAVPPGDPNMEVAAEPLKAEADARAQQREWERLRASVNFESLASRIRRLALGVFLESDVSSSVFTSSGASALHAGISKAIQGVNGLTGRVFDRLARMPMAQRMEESLERNQDRQAESRKHDPKRTIVPVPAVRLCPGMLHPVSFNEEQMLRLFVNDTLSMAYSLSSGLRNQVPLDPKQSQLSQLIISSRHDVLRSAYRMDDFGNPSRKVEREHQGDQLMLCVKDVGDCNAIQAAEFAYANPLGISSIRYNIELAQNNWGHQGYCMNHILGDADAMTTYWQESFMIQGLLFQGYSEEAVVERLPALPVQMVDFAYWQRSLVSQGLLEPDVAVWFSDVASVHPPVVLDVPIDIPRRRAWTAVGENYFCHLSGDLVSVLQEVNHRATPFAVVTAAFSIILSRLSGTRCVNMGTPFALRMLASLQNLIGDFVNMICFKVNHDPSESFLSILDRAASSAVDVQRYAMAPFLLFVNSVQRFYVTNDPARNAIYQTMIDVVPKDNEDPNPSMSGILDLFLFANTYKGALWSIECTSNSTILTRQTVLSILVQVPVLVRRACCSTKAELPPSMPCPEEARLVAEGRRLVLTHLRLKVGPLPHVVGVASGWELEGEPQECSAIRAARRLKGQSCLELGADLPLAGSRAQRPPSFVVKMEMKIQEQMARQQEEREKRLKPKADVEGPAPVALAPDDVATAAGTAPTPALPAPAREEKGPEDLEAQVLAEIEERRAEVRRKLAARSVAKGRLKESKLASELIGLDLEPPPSQEAPPLRLRGGRPLARKF
mmetsp:Transcript_105922/g.326895  ORF Transcript_105922/g.326895 Transcript_105922/m.326895 type:complete len:892 (-) Transcript_105922:152-2827(-)